MAKKKKKSCKTCGYADKCGADPCCVYILVEKHRRPCPASDGCAAWRSKDEVNKRKLLLEQIQPLVPTKEAARWQKLFRDQQRDEKLGEWKNARKRERAAAIAQLKLGTKQRREMEAPR